MSEIYDNLSSNDLRDIERDEAEYLRQMEDARADTLRDEEEDMARLNKKAQDNFLWVIKKIGGLDGNNNI